MPQSLAQDSRFAPVEEKIALPQRLKTKDWSLRTCPFRESVRHRRGASNARFAVEVAELNTGHDSHVESPSEVADILLAAAQAQ